MRTGFDRYELHDRVLEKLPLIGFTLPTNVQHRVIPLFIQKKNLLVEAATGTGKTAAYGLPLISRLDYSKKKTQALILVPSRELAVQVEEALNNFSNVQGLQIEAMYGGGSLNAARDKIRKRPHILIAVPGRLRDALRDDDFPFFWNNINFLIIDEADKLLEQGFQHELDILLKNVKKRCQIGLFSATISEDIEGLIRERFRPIMTIRLSPKEALGNIKFHYSTVKEGKTEGWLLSLIEGSLIPKALIFVNKREEVESITRYLKSAGKVVEGYHGLMDQVERSAIMNRFKKGMLNYLVATDLAARGLDVEYLPAVINCSFPTELQVYLHRAGRTGRAGLPGDCYNLVGSMMEEIRVKAFHKEIDIPLKKNEIKWQDLKQVTKGEVVKQVRIHLSRGKKDKIRKGDVVGFLANEIGLEGDQIGTIAIYDEYLTVDIPEKHLNHLTHPDASWKIKGKTVKVRKYSAREQDARAKARKKLIITQKKRKQLKAKKDQKQNKG